MATREGKNHFEVVVVDGSIIKHTLKGIEWEVMNWILVSGYRQVACRCEAVMKI
jgi:hypothetical protein